MELSFTQLLLGAAGLHVLLALILAVRALDTRAGGWSLVLGLLFAGHAGALSLVVHGYPRAALLLWVIHALIPLGMVPLAIAVANTGLLRRALLWCNALVGVAVVAWAAWLVRDIQVVATNWGARPLLAPGAEIIWAWAALIWGVALIDSLFQLTSAGRERVRVRLLGLLIVLVLAAFGWTLDTLVISAQAQALQAGLGPWGGGFYLAAHIALCVLLWISKGPRRISGTVPPSVVQGSVQPVLIADSDGRVQAANAAAVRVLERRRHQVLGNHLRSVIGLDIEHLDAITRLHGAGYVERVRLPAQPGKPMRELALQPMMLRARDGEVLALICTLHPGSEDPALAATSLQDPVTGLAGAALGEALLAQELRRHAGGSGPLVGAVFARLDDSGGIAAQHGQEVHDRLHNAVRERLDAVCDWPLDLARTSGGGYVMLLTQVGGRDEVLAIAERTCEQLNQPYTIDGHSLTPPAAVAVIPDLRVYHDILDVLADAQHGLEQARHIESGPFVAGERAEERTGLALAMESAIANDGLDVLLEPVLDLRSERPVGARVALRWEPQSIPPLSDEAVRRMARRVHLEGALNRWRLKQLAQLRVPKAWAVWLPVSVEELQAPGFTQVFVDLTARLPFKVLIEVPDAVWRLPACRRIAGELIEAGLGLHAAEFSCGNRMLTHAADLHPRTLALEARLVQNHAPAVDAATRGLVETAAALEATLLATGVRKKADAQRLRTMGVALACGEYFGAAMSPQQFAGWLADDAALREKFAGTSIAVSTRKAVGERRTPSLA